MSGDATLAEWIERIRALGDLPELVAPDVARELELQIDANIAAGRAPSGTPWKLTAKGKVPLRRAAAAVTVRALGPVVIARVTGPEAKHHLGKAAGRIRRQILPGRNSRTTLAALKAVVQRRMREAVTGG
jgi:hypothetical protein